MGRDGFLLIFSGSLKFCSGLNLLLRGLNFDFLIKFSSFFLCQTPQSKSKAHEKRYRLLFSNIDFNYQISQPNKKISIDPIFKYTSEFLFFKYTSIECIWLSITRKLFAMNLISDIMWETSWCMAYNFMVSEARRLSNSFWLLSIKKELLSN